MSGDEVEAARRERVGRVAEFAGDADPAVDRHVLQVVDAEGNMSTGTLNLSVIAVDLPNVTNVKINNGAAQRSKLKTIEITFDQVVNGTNAANAIIVQKRSDAVGGGAATTVDGVVVSSATVGSGPTAHTVVTLTFTPSSTSAPNPHVDGTGSLVDGNYQVTVNASLVTASTGGFKLDGNNDGLAGDNFVFGEKASDRFFRMFGELDGGNAAGQSTVNSFDAGAFLNAYNKPANYDAVFDLNDDGLVNSFDAGQFLGNYLKQRDLNGFTP